VTIRGAGGSSAAVSATAGGAISTGDLRADAILAQSVGGSGGVVYTGNVNFSSDGAAEINVAVGGSGGHGGVAGATSVTNNAAILTEGHMADDVLAQSIGGSGGRGGSAYTVLTQIEGGTNVNLGATVGGTGGSGQDAGAVTVGNSGAITTQSGGSAAIHAQSVGGGGKGGAAANLNLNPGAERGQRGLDPRGHDHRARRRRHGCGRRHQRRHARHRGDHARALYAQSIGGGGDDGTTSSASFSYNFVNAWTDDASYQWIANLPGNFTFLPDLSDLSDIATAVGGSAGTSGHGGVVEVTGTAPIETSGDHAFGVHAQSIGGGDVTVSQSSFIATSGAGGVGVFAQSVGGGGAAAGDIETGWTSSWLDLNIGAGVRVQQAAGGGGAGGAVSVTAGPITTTGATPTPSRRSRSAGRAGSRRSRATCRPPLSGSMPATGATSP